MLSKSLSISPSISKSTRKYTTVGKLGLAPPQNLPYLRPRPYLSLLGDQAYQAIHYFMWTSFRSDTSKHLLYCYPILHGSYTDQGTSLLLQNKAHTEARGASECVPGPPGTSDSLVHGFFIRNYVISSLVLDSLKLKKLVKLHVLL